MNWNSDNRCDRLRTHIVDLLLLCFKKNTPTATYMNEYEYEQWSRFISHDVHPINVFKPKYLIVIDHRMVSLQEWNIELHMFL